MNWNELPTTGQVAQKLTAELGRPITERAVNGILRGTYEVRPPVVNRRRRWRPKDINGLRTLLEQREGKSIA